MKASVNDLGRILLEGAMVCALAMMGTKAQAEPAPAGPIAVTAIDIALEPDSTMMRHAEAVNARLLEAYPKGFALDASHHPHITMLQSYVRTADLDKAYAAAGKVVASANVGGLKLKALKYYFIPDRDLGLAGIVIEPTDELIELQKDLLDAIAPFAEKTGTAAAFVTTPEDPDINPAGMKYIEEFVHKYSGRNFNPHVTVGVAGQDYLKPMLAEPFEAFTSSPVGVTVYHLGDYGTARTRLWEFPLKP